MLTGKQEQLSVSLFRTSSVLQGVQAQTRSCQRKCIHFLLKESRKIETICGTQRDFKKQSRQSYKRNATPGSSPGTRYRIRLDEMCYGSVELENDASLLYMQ